MRFAGAGAGAKAMAKGPPVEPGFLPPGRPLDHLPASLGEARVPIQPLPGAAGEARAVWPQAFQLELPLAGAGYRESRSGYGLRSLRPWGGISTPRQQHDALVASAEFIARLADVRQTRRLSRELRQEARTLARHYPDRDQLERIAARGLALELAGTPVAQQTGTKWEPS